MRPDIKKPNKTIKKTLVFFTLCLSINMVVSAQTNTFPTTGNVGIGTLSPSTNFHLKGSSDGLFTLQTADNNWLYTNWLDNTGSRRLWMGLGSDLTSFNINLENGTNKILLNGGKVGIGTTNPSEKLEITDNVNGPVYIGVNNFTTGSNSVSGIKLGFGSTPYDRGSFIYHKASNNTLYFSNTGDPNSKFSFKTRNLSGSYVDALDISSNGDIGIGTSTPDSKLTVKGNIHTNEVKVDLLGAVAPDYVFYADYNLKSLKEVETYIVAKGHLPNIPSAKELEINGLHLKEMNLRLLEKIEELTLYAIGQEKRIRTLEEDNCTSKKQEARIKLLEEQVATLLKINK